jgi:hypothetical protein
MPVAGSGRGGYSMMCIRRLAVLLAASALGAMLAGTSSAEDVLPGYDLFETTAPTYQNFTDAFTIAPDFFGPGSDPFDGVVYFKGQPYGSLPWCPGDVGETDMILYRPETAFLPGPGCTDEIPIEIVGLSLTSIDPIVVTYNGGSHEIWEVSMETSAYEPSSGIMLIYQTRPAGGIFAFQVTLYPKFTFTHDFEVRTLDGGLLGLFDYLEVMDVGWVYDDPNLVCPSCCSNFHPGPHNQMGPLAGHNVIPGCPGGSAGVPGDAGSPTWGSIKAIYR